MESRHQSVWTATSAKSSYPKLSKNLQVEVAVIGGGIAGLMSAYELQFRGKKVALFEAGRIGQGTTSFTTAKVTILHDAKYGFLKSHFGEDKALMYARSNQQAIDHLAEVITKEHIECGFERRSAYLYTGSSGQEESI